MNKVSKCVLSFCILVTLILPAIMDLNSTHMTNPLWAPHARFHWSIQFFSITAINTIALYLLWGHYADKGSRLSVFISGLAPILFWGSFFPSLLMPGTSPWPDGMIPFATIPPNVFIALLISLLSGWAVFWDFRARTNS